MRREKGFPYETLGFDKMTFFEMTVDSAFILYSIDANGIIIANNSFSCPLSYNDSIVGIIGVVYDSTSNEVCCSLGKEYSYQLQMIRDHAFKDDNEIAVCALLGDLIATDGKDIFVCTNDNNGSQVLKNNTRELAQRLFSEAQSHYYPQRRMHLEHDATIDKTRGVDPLTNVLPVPHVPQTGGVCGTATLAALLNYRYGLSHTASGLLQLMNLLGYNSNAPSGSPTMDDYLRFVNYFYSGPFVTSFTLPFANMLNAIDGGRPIMGSWFTGSPGSYAWHAVLIIGYIEHVYGQRYTYYIKNPWYSAPSVITVRSHSNVLYPAGGSVWKLNSVLY